MCVINGEGRTYKKVGNTLILIIGINSYLGLSFTTFPYAKFVATTVVAC